jgi:hypothetical protein
VWYRSHRHYGDAAGKYVKSDACLSQRPTAKSGEHLSARGGHDLLGKQKAELGYLNIQHVVELLFARSIALLEYALRRADNRCLLEAESATSKASCLADDASQAAPTSRGKSHLPLAESA